MLKWDLLTRSTQENSFIVNEPEGVLANSSSLFLTTLWLIWTTWTISVTVRLMLKARAAKRSAAPHSPVGRRPVEIQSRFIRCTMRVANRTTYAVYFLLQSKYAKCKARIYFILFLAKIKNISKTEYILKIIGILNLFSIDKPYQTWICRR